VESPSAVFQNIFSSSSSSTSFSYSIPKLIAFWGPEHAQKLCFLHTPPGECVKLRIFGVFFIFREK